MSLIQLYPWIKALHVAAALVFTAGLMSTTLFLSTARGMDPVMHSTVKTLRRWDRFMTVPAMLAVWIFGITLASSGHWFGQSWLSSKFFLVIVMSGLHGVQAAKLRRLSEGLAIKTGSTKVPILLVCICSIAVLAIIKPH